MNWWNRHVVDGVVYRFSYPNDERKNVPMLREAFKAEGMEIADVQWILTFETWVLTTAGDLYFMDGSNGGGGVFSLESKAK